MTYWAGAADRECTCIHLQDGARIGDPRCAAQEHRRP